jgi:hypothetical protein
MNNMYLRLAAAVLLVTCIFLVGCCAFAPCHFGTSLIGTVSDSLGRPIANAQVTLYGSVFKVNENGCFHIHSADALPFIFAVNAKGFKPAEVGTKWGFFAVKVQLAATESPKISSIEWHPISQDQFMASASCKI